MTVAKFLQPQPLEKQQGLGIDLFPLDNNTHHPPHPELPQTHPKPFPLTLSVFQTQKETEGHSKSLDHVLGSVTVRLMGITLL